MSKSYIRTQHGLIKCDVKTGTLALILELMDRNLYEMIKGRKNYLPESEVKSLMWQLMQGLSHIHNNGIFHRDVKPENILIRDQILKIADFGSCKNIHSRYPYTEYISTRWYRAPECLLTDGYYSFEMDLWSVGCVIFEILSLRPLFPGANEVDQIGKIHDVFGTPDPIILKTFKKSRSMSFNFPTKKGTGLERMLTHVSPDAINLIKQLCQYDPNKRATAHSAIQHSFFKDFRSNSVLTNGGDQLRKSVLRKQHKGSLVHIPIEIKENKENSLIEANKDTTFAMADMNLCNSSRSTYSKSPYSVVSTTLVKSDNSNKLQEIPFNFNRKSNMAMEGQILPPNIVSKKKPRRMIVENSNSKSWPTQSFLPKLYNTNILPDVNSQTAVINSYFPRDQPNYIKTNSLSKYSKYYSNNKNSNIAQLHRRYHLRPSFK